MQLKKQKANLFDLHLGGIVKSIYLLVLISLYSLSAMADTILNGSSFNSQSSQVKDQGGFLFVAGQPIFIGDNGEILVKVNGNFLPADPNTTSQVLSMYRTWANDVRNGKTPNNSRFAIANRALNAPLIRGGNSPDTSNIPLNPSIPRARNGGQHSNDTSNPNSSRSFSPLSEEQNEFNTSIDRSNLRIFKDNQNHLFFMDKDNSKKHIFSLNTFRGNKIAFQMNQESSNEQSGTLKIIFTDPRFLSKSEISITEDRAKLTCNNEEKVFTEITIESKKNEALDSVQFRSLAGVTLRREQGPQPIRTLCESVVP